MTQLKVSPEWSTAAESLKPASLPLPHSVTFSRFRVGSTTHFHLITVVKRTTRWGKLAAFSLQKVFVFQTLADSHLNWTFRPRAQFRWVRLRSRTGCGERARHQTENWVLHCWVSIHCKWILKWHENILLWRCVLCCNRDIAGVWAMTAGLMMYSVAGLYSRRSFWPFISLSPLPVTVITSRNESCASWQSALLWKLIGRHFFFTSLDIFSFSFTFLLLSFSSPSLPVSCFPLIVFKSLFISPFLFQFYLFNWFVCFTRQEMHSSHSLGRLHITHFGNVKSRSPHIWSASLCVSAVQVRWFKHWLTAMMD